MKKKLMFIAIGLLVLIACLAVPVSATVYYFENGQTVPNPYSANGHSYTKIGTGNYYDEYEEADFISGYVALPQTCGVSSFTNGSSLKYLGESGNFYYGDTAVCLAASAGSAPASAFSGTPTSGEVPLTVIFTDASTNTPTSWYWDFGDGNTTENTVQNPIHLYTTAGTYTVNLTATNEYGSDYEYKSSYITVSEESGYSCGATYCYNLSESISAHGSDYAIILQESVAMVSPLYEFRLFEDQLCGSDDFPVGTYNAVTHDEVEVHPAEDIEYTGNTYQCVNYGDAPVPEIKNYYTAVSASSNYWFAPSSELKYLMNSLVFKAPYSTKYLITTIANGGSGSEDDPIGYAGENESIVVFLAKNSGIGMYVGAPSNSPCGGYMSFGDVDTCWPWIDNGLNVSYLLMHVDGETVRSGETGTYKLAPEDATFSMQGLHISDYLTYPERGWGAGGYFDNQSSFNSRGITVAIFVEWTSATHYFFITFRDSITNQTIPGVSFSYSKGGLSESKNNINGTILLSSIESNAISTGSYTISTSATNYTAVNTSIDYSTPGDEFIIYLSHSGVTSPAGSYFYPVTVTDATTGNTIADSWLTSGIDTYYSRPSATGKFNVTGKGALGATALEEGDQLTLAGNATGYEDNYFAIIVSDENNGITQFLNLAPSSAAPASGEFTALVSVYDDDTTAALSGVSLALKKGSNSTSKTTGASGSAVFKNLTAGDSYSITAIKTGYTPVTKSVTGGSGAIVNVDIPMSSVGVNPTVTPTATTTGGIGGGSVSSDDLNAQGASGLSEFMNLVINGKLWLLGLLLIMVFAVRKAFGS
jgi:PKD repeat protein